MATTTTDASGDGATVIETDRNTETAADDEQTDASVDPSDYLDDCALAISALGQTASGLTVPGSTDGDIDTLREIVPDGLQSDVDLLEGAIGDMQAAFADAGVESGDRDGIQEVMDENEDTLDPARDSLDEIEDHFSETCDG